MIKSIEAGFWHTHEVGSEEQVVGDLVGPEVVGDSVGENMALFLENAHAGIGVLKHQRESYREQINLQGRNQDRIWVSHVPEEKGGGYVAFAR